MDQSKDRSVRQRTSIVLLLAAFCLLAAGHFYFCPADADQDSTPPPATYQYAEHNAPISYQYFPKNGSIDDQSRALLDARKRDLEISKNGRSGNESRTGIYALLSLVAGSIGIAAWRRLRSTA
jgi:hypothetical protein